MVAQTVAQTVTSRALRILEVFTHTHSHLSLSQISCRAELPLSTTHRLVAELTTWGALERDETGRYRIGLRLWELGALAPRGIGLREAALPFMEDLYEATHENVQLAILDQTQIITQIVYVERLRGRDAVPVYTRPGLRFTPHATGVGLVLLAYASADLQQRYLTGPLHTFTHKTISDPQHLRCVLAQIRRDGYVISDGQVTLDALSVAAPVRAAGQVIAALSIVVHAVRHPAPSSLTPAVVAAAKGVSRTLTSFR
ncbi:MAG TPA: IclR family transcriptional regulator [Candidatus Limnocylindrales bacterium]|nr:IclR family transcriptional regulator [Candidatus Limnocylindrales bacterium]